MGLFKKSSPAEKKLKELTGGFLLSTSFMNRLKENNIDIKEGEKIKKQLKEEIGQGIVNENNLEPRLTELINNYSNNDFESDTIVNPSDIIKSSKKECPKCNRTQDVENNVCIECGYRFNKMDSKSNKTQKNCPVCDESQDLENLFCINCGHDFSSNIKIETAGKICPNCNKEQDVSNVYCISCGYDFINNSIKESNKSCPICGKKQDSKNNICVMCGYDFIKKRKRVEHKTCPNCNNKLFKETNHCPNCHYDFKLGRVPDKFLKCPYCGESITKNTKKCPNCNYSFVRDNPLELILLNDFINKTAFLSNYDFNIKTCPDCNSQLLKVDPFCFNCGATVVTNETVKNENLKVKDGKLVANDEVEKHEELSSLEALYSQTVKSKYSPSFKIAYVLYLEEFRINPLKKFSDKTAKKYETTVNKLKKQALEDEFIEIASPLVAANDAKVTELKEILKEHNLKVSGKKDELIERLGENLTDDELKKYFKVKNYQISNKGLEFLENNNYILYIYKNPDVSRVFYPSEINKIFEEKHYSIEEIHEKLLVYLKKVLDNKLTQELWVDFKIYANAIAFIQEDKNDLKDALNMRLKVFLFDLNNYSIVLHKPDPRKTKLRKKDVSKLNELMHRMTLPIDELKELFGTSYNEVLFKMDISKDDALIYLLKVFSGEDLDTISKEINERYSTPY